MSIARHPLILFGTKPPVIGGFDTDAQAFFDASGITDSTQKNAVNQLVLDLKAASIWSKMKAIYPMVGGTASTHKWNLKDPRDLDAAFRLVFSGGWTHSSTGALPNGTNAWADTFWNPSTEAPTSPTFGYYNRTNTAKGYDMGLGFGSTEFMITNRYSATASAGAQIPNGGYRITATSATGFAVASMELGNTLILYKNGTNLNQQTGRTLSNTNSKLAIGARNNGGTIAEYTDHECAFSFIGDGLSATDQSNLYTAVQEFNTTLSRNV
jgi:hypothetical protein